MNADNNNRNAVTLAIDAMGGDAGPEAVISGVAHAVKRGLKAKMLIFGDRECLAPLIGEFPGLKNVEIRHADNVVTMTDKPSHVIRRGRDTSMWAAMSSVKEGEAQAVVSCGNTGALMALARSAVAYDRRC